MKVTGKAELDTPAEEPKPAKKGATPFKRDKNTAWRQPSVTSEELAMHDRRDKDCTYFQRHLEVGYTSCPVCNPSKPEPENGKTQIPASPAATQTSVGMTVTAQKRKCFNASCRVDTYQGASSPLSLSNCPLCLMPGSIV